ncbi:InlB_B-repeat-containing protein [Hexamita inflata]|uniref:InlB B-repeat-containing protein n=1 Tax=Hexamita inflata TaxID=28002 RepID=A0AA86QCI2_9EUKA|nr:InlB B-repeat-containing protein [Hexamita inflata]
MINQIQFFTAMLNIILTMPVSNVATQQSPQQKICSNILFKDHQILFCTKESTLSSQVQTASIISSPSQLVHHTIYTERIQDLQLNLNYQMQNLPSFAIFGLTSNIQLLDSSISVKVPQQLTIGCLICLTCDFNASSSDFVFISSGQNISGLVFTTISRIIVNQSLLQFRLNGVNVGGLLFNASDVTVTLADCNISEYIIGDVKGSIICYILDSVILNADNVKICSNVANQGQGTLTLNGVITETCVLCRDATYSYGLCSKSLEFGAAQNDKLECTYPFIFDGERCSCPEGQVVNEKTCVDILGSVNLLKIQQELINTQVIDLVNRTGELESIQQVLISDQNIQKGQIQNLFDLSNKTQNSISNNFTKLQQNILGNYSLADKNLQTNTSVLDQRIFNNMSGLSNSIQILNTYQTVLNHNITLINESISSQKNITAGLQQNISDLQSSIDSSNVIIQQQQKLITQLSLLTQCMNNIDQLNITGQCVLVDSTDDSVSCSQKIYLYTFDITDVTNAVIAGSFSKGYVFNTNIQNAFIVVAADVYNSQSTLNPLFQSQGSFTNIKIRFDTQSIKSGSFISSTSKSITINYMNIISKSGSQITQAASSQLNILTPQTTSAVISNLQVNLSFAPSSGIITLIASINGVFNMTNYHVLGTYCSTLTVAMISLNIISAANVNQVSFKPSTFNVGSSSSYLFSQVSGSLIVNNLAVVIGNRSNYLLLSQIETTDKSSNYYRFGGIAANINSASNITVNYAIYDCYQQVSTTYVSYSGFLIGNSQSQNTTLLNICFKQSMISSSTQFNWFGLVGSNNNNISVINASVTLFLNGAVIYSTGFIGFQEFSAYYAQVTNLKSSLSFISQSGQYIGQVVYRSFVGQGRAANCFVTNSTLSSANISVNAHSVAGFIGSQGYNMPTNTTITNSSVNNSNISGLGSVGGFIGYQAQNFTIINSTVNKVNISGENAIGGLISFQGQNATIIDSIILSANISGNEQIGGLIGCSQSTLQLTNTKIQFVHVFGTNYLGVVIGQNADGAKTILGSSGAGNFIRNVAQQNCTFVNSWSPTQC